jgi:serine phosphatase RsbU (regulator of sigma subunit)
MTDLNFNRTLHLKIDEAVKDIWIKLAIVAIPLWLSWIYFDYLFAPEHISIFLTPRVLASISSLMLIYTLKKNLLSLNLAINLYYLFYSVAMAIMFIYIDSSVFYIYFTGYQMIIIVFAFLSTLTLNLLFSLLIQNIIVFAIILIYSKLSPSEVLANGGFVFLNILVISNFVAFLNIKRVKNQILSQLKLEHSFAVIEQKNEEILDSIIYAKRIQDAILPSRKTLSAALKNGFVLFKPKDVVSGDFYWMEQPNNETIFLAAADCTGHGVPGAMVSVVCSNALSKCVLEENISQPALILNRTRELVVSRFAKNGEEVKDGMDVSLVSLAHRMESERGSEGREIKMQWAGANNPLWIIRKGASEVEEYKADKQPIGKYSEEKPFTNHEITLNEGDTFYLFSDGYPDQFGGEKAKKFKAANFKQLLLSVQELPMDEQKIIIDKTFEDWKGELEQVDDVCVIGVRI